MNISWSGCRYLLLPNGNEWETEKAIKSSKMTAEDGFG